jgi:signal transduction histidine kinase
VRRRFLARFAIGVVMVFVLVIAGPLIVLGQILSAAGLPAPSAGVVAALFIIALIWAIAFGAGRVRRFGLSAGDLIEAAGRLEAGDYSARAQDYGHGPRELRTLVAAFNAMASHLEEDERQRRSLLADVSHELRTPLAVLQGELEAMIDGIHPADEAHLQAAVDDVRLLTRLVEDLRTLALADAGTLALHRESTDLSVLAQEAAASFETLAAASGVTVRVDVAPDVPLLELDPLRIRQVLSNLIANALRYAPAGSAVTVAAERNGGAVTVSVADSGPGFDPAVLPQLFERFAKSADSRGSGLGLAIARRLVEAHGGTIRAEQAAGGGAVIRFELPIQPA